jgi:hypothetical protein
MRENSHAKARRYLLEARLQITRVDGGLIEAVFRSDDAVVYRLGHSEGRFWCSCPAISAECCHLRALKLVTIVGSTS